MKNGRLENDFESGKKKKIPENETIAGANGLFQK